MLKVLHPPTYGAEREYILRVVIGEWLGLDYAAEAGDVHSLQITRTDDPSHARLEVADVLFSTSPEAWLTESSLPSEIASWSPDPPLPGVPGQLAVVFGRAVDNGTYLLADRGLVRLGLDVFGAAFFMLTRYEELVSRQRDEFDRFSSRFSVLEKSDLLGRPIVNEHVELLWWALQSLWPDLARVPRQYRCLLSCDLDNLSIMGAGPWLAIRKVGGGSVRDSLRFGPWYGVLSRVAARWRAWQGVPGADALDDVDFLMDQAEAHGCKFVFNFIAARPRSLRDPTYQIDRLGIRRLMRRIHERGHELGFHGSYESFKDPAKIRREFNCLTRTAEEEGIVQPHWGGRQHYLRWEGPTTWQAYADAGLAYDSTLTYADQAGFRCGTCYEFPVFNLLTRQPLKLFERPLVVMDGTLYKCNYMRLSDPEALQTVATLSRSCMNYKGDFTLLWHNGNTNTPEDRSRCVDLLRAAATGRITSLDSHGRGFA
jgi:hypothetical protein